MPSSSLLVEHEFFCCKKAGKVWCGQGASAEVGFWHWHRFCLARTDVSSLLNFAILIVLYLSVISFFLFLLYELVATYPCIIPTSFKASSGSTNFH